MRDIIEVKNAIKVYEDLKCWNALSLLNFKEAHKELMQDLIATNGQ